MGRYPYQKKIQITNISKKLNQDDLKISDVSVFIIKQKIVSTNYLENKLLTTKKLIIEGEIFVNNFKIPFSSFIVLPLKISSKEIFDIKAYVEDFKVCVIDECTLLKQIDLNLSATLLDL